MRMNLEFPAVIIMASPPWGLFPTFRLKVDSRKLHGFMKKSISRLLTYDLKERAVYSKEDHLRLLISASLVNGFAEGVSKSLDESPTAETLFSYVKAQSE